MKQIEELFRLICHVAPTVMAPPKRPRATPTKFRRSPTDDANGFMHTGGRDLGAPREPKYEQSRMKRRLSGCCCCITCRASVHAYVNHKNDKLNETFTQFTDAFGESPATITIELKPFTTFNL
ncbi:hypothetical protein CBL_11441 [Carabus blaptoides fortunei]